VTLVALAGVQREVTVAGFYSPKDMEGLVDQNLADPAHDILVSNDLALELGGPRTPIVEADTRLVLRLMPGLAVTVLPVAIALVSATPVARRPIQARPLVVLRDE
jgi:hypothetical protein